MRAIMLAAGAALALAACSGNNDESADTLEVNNLVVDSNSTMTMDGNVALDPATGMPLNSADPAAQNAIEQDLTHNDVDANLANGI